ncbi:MAG: Phosphoglycolate phosphatase [Rickettsiales bacterium]|jgi:phosphoglycolate phosphatase|nr:Phosphoglycolate phosphatase [Rickettsiales bacterium]
MTLTTPKAILFDWDNTLADTWPIIHRSLHKTFTDMGHTPWTIEEVKEKVHRSMRDSFPEIFGDDWEKASSIYQTFFTENHLKDLEVLEGAVDVLTHLRAKDVYMAVVSNKTGHNLRKEVTHIGWDRFFDKVVGAKDAREDKPSSAPVLLALEGSGIALGPDVWLIGDSLTDLECAYNSGITPIFYGDADLSEERFRPFPPKRHLRNHDELLAFFESVGLKERQRA